MNHYYVKNVDAIAKQLIELNSNFKKHDVCALYSIAVQIQANELFAEANLLNRENAPVCLEKIAMNLGNIADRLP